MENKPMNGREAITAFLSLNPIQQCQLFNRVIGPEWHDWKWDKLHERDMIFWRKVAEENLLEKTSATITELLNQPS